MPKSSTPIMGGGTPPTEQLRLANFGRNLRTLREERRLSQSDLARKVWGTITDSRGYTVARNRDRISIYESGKARPDDTNLKALADALGVTVAELAPDLVAKSLDRAAPAIAMNMVQGHPEQVHLVINTLTSLSTASEVIRLLSADPTTAAASAPGGLGSARGSGRQNRPPPEE